MSALPSLNTRAILLLTAPLHIGRGRSSSPKPLTLREYNRLARQLRESQHEPADLLDSGEGTWLDERGLDLEAGRLELLLGRAFLLSQAIERWQRRDIWVISRADADYPHRLKQRLRELAPPVLYGCGQRANFAKGGLAVVGSRNVDEALISDTERVGRLAAAAGHTLVSGGARGIDQAAVRGALAAGGTAVCVLADSLERAATRRDYRDALMGGRLVLTCPHDPASGFFVGQAMQRNKLIYLLADAALVIRTEFEKGGTWAGAVEHLDKHRSVPVYVRVGDEPHKGVEALRERGARPWPNPGTAQALDTILSASSGTVPEEGLESPARAPQDNQSLPEAARPPAAATTVPEAVSASRAVRGHPAPLFRECRSGEDSD